MGGWIGSCFRLESILIWRLLQSLRSVQGWDGLCSVLGEDAMPLATDLVFSLLSVHPLTCQWWWFYCGRPSSKPEHNPSQPISSEIGDGSLVGFTVLCRTECYYNPCLRLGASCQYLPVARYKHAVKHEMRLVQPACCGLKFWETHRFWSPQSLDIQLWCWIAMNCQDNPNLVTQFLAGYTDGNPDAKAQWVNWGSSAGSVGSGRKRKEEMSEDMKTVTVQLIFSWNIWASLGLCPDGGIYVSRLRTAWIGNNGLSCQGKYIDPV